MRSYNRYLCTISENRWGIVRGWKNHPLNLSGDKGSWNYHSWICKNNFLAVIKFRLKWCKFTDLPFTENKYTTYVFCTKSNLYCFTLRENCIDPPNHAYFQNSRIAKQKESYFPKKVLKFKCHKWFNIL